MTKIRYGIALYIYLLFTSVAGGQNFSDSLTIELNKHWKQSGLPGFAVSIVSADQVIYEHGFGYANRETETPFTPETIINLGSISNTVVGVAIIKAIEDAALTMDSDISNYLPFEIKNPYYPNIPILVRHLCTHSSTIQDTRHYPKTYLPLFPDLDDESSSEFSGFIHEHEKISLAEFIERTHSKNGQWYKSRNFLNAKPGSYPTYSHLNASIAALVIENSTFYPFGIYTRQKIFEPLDMHSTGWAIEDIDIKKYATLYFPNGGVVSPYKLITYPDGGLLSNTADLGKFLREIINVSLGKSEFLNERYSQVLLPGDGDSDQAFWGLDGNNRNLGQMGSDPGVQAELLFDKDQKIGRIVLCNVSAREDADLYNDYLEIHQIITKYQNKLR